MKGRVAGEISRSLITDITPSMDSDGYEVLKKAMKIYENQAVYIYSFKEGKMLYASGFYDLLGYKDEEMNMLLFVSLTSKKHSKFANELNEKALLFLNDKTENLEKYSFTIELEKIHKNGSNIPIFSRVSVFKASNGVVEQIIGVSEAIDSLRLGHIMQYAAYGPDKTYFEDTLNKDLFNYFAISRKEKEALQLASEGFCFKEIADKLNVSNSAIEKRIIPMYKRFNVNSLTHLVGFAYRNNILK